MISAWWILFISMLYVAILLILLEYREHQWRIERKDLCDRIMAGGLTEYRNEVIEKPPPRGGNMVTAGLKKAHNQQMKMLGGDD
jgi:hypothetical protein